MQLLLLSTDEVERLLDPDALLDALAGAFTALSAGEVAAPPRNQVAAGPAGVVLAMPAHRAGHPVTIKLVSVFHDNDARGLPAHHALICLFDEQTGVPVCVMDGGAITAQRTAGAAALATRLLARQDARILAIVGAGVQGQAHLALLPRVRAFAEIRVASRHLAHAERLAARDARAYAVATVEEAVRGADVVCLCTNAATPVLSAAWLAPGAHVTSVGYRPPDGELERGLIEQSHLFVETRQAFDPPPAGCGELTGLDPAAGTELGELLLGQRPGRRSASELTIYKAMGHACEDLAAASLVYARARQVAQQGIGTTITL